MIRNRLATIDYVAKKDETVNHIISKLSKLSQKGVQDEVSYLPTPPLGQDMTQGQFLSRV